MSSARSSSQSGSPASNETPTRALATDLRRGPYPVLTSSAGERIELIACVGRGATGGVYRARTTESHLGFARDVCIKRLSGQLSVEGERAMREEARLLASLRHANVVSLLAIGQEPSGAPFLVLELIDGANLRVLEKAVARKSHPAHVHASMNTGLPDQVAVHIACALVRALGAVQRAIPGLVHRDVTPHNVLISREGEVKLTDFGIALALDRARWTRPSVVKGKFGYMAPEQIRGEPLDVRTDLFAVGVVLFELVARRRPWFAPEGTLDELRAIERGEIASILECRPKLDRALAMAIDRLLALDPRDRFQSCDAALRALAPFGAGDLGSLRLAAIVDSVLPRADGNRETSIPSALPSRSGTESAPRLDSGPRSSVPRRASGSDLVAYGPSLEREDDAAIESSARHGSGTVERDPAMDRDA
jgi:serine/threonine protein kinase